MEIKSELQKPYTEKERMDFIAEYNHNQGYSIQEVEEGLQAWGDTEVELLQKARARIDCLSLTSADVERAVYKAKGMDFEDIIELVKDIPSIDIKALKIELKANSFYRGNPYVNAVGEVLGFTSQMLDEFFETNDYTKLIGNQ